MTRIPEERRRKRGNHGSQRSEMISSKEESTGVMLRLLQWTERDGNTLLANVPPGIGGSKC